MEGSIVKERQATPRMRVACDELTVGDDCRWGQEKSGRPSYVGNGDGIRLRVITAVIGSNLVEVLPAFMNES